jgi:(1->4)-alpha-D-glucan 1-alpha-D-glucosylmutase
MESVLTTSQLDTDAVIRHMLDDPAAGTPPRATYRLQFNRSFTFDDAVEIVPWLASLGVSHLYASPIFRARPGSMHGYDVVDYGEINPELGGAQAFARLVSVVHEHHLKILVDFVPNHMGIEGGANVWWQDVLEHGPASPYESFFDIDWTSFKVELRDKVLLPVLGSQYGVVLESGELQVRYEAGSFTVWYWETPLPVNPVSYPVLLQPVVERVDALLGDDDLERLELESIITAFERLPEMENGEAPGEYGPRYREQLVTRRRLEDLTERSEIIREVIDTSLLEINGQVGNPRSFDHLDELLGQQSWRLAFWRVAGEEINYRRFFAINTLAAIRQEEPRVFRETHRVLMEHLASGAIDGVRIDHPDGLWDPEGYFFDLQAEFLSVCAMREAGVAPAFLYDEEHKATFEALRASARAAVAERAAERRQWPLYVLAEKILEYGETLPDSWAIAGTVGYEFAHATTAVFVDITSRQMFDRILSRFTGDTIRFPELVYLMKHQMMSEAFQSEIAVLTNALNRITEEDRRNRDFTLNNLRSTLTEVMACFPVYRTYTTCEDEGVVERDRRYIEEAVAAAKRRNPGRDPSVFDFLQDVLLLHVSREPGAIARFTRRCYFAMKFQQLSGPVMAKGLEDTAFYRYSRLVSLNEVGGDPSRFGINEEEFHRQNRQRLRRWPHAMINSSTHDTKRSEDVRARISALSHDPASWRAAVNRWSRLNRKLKRKLDGALAPHRSDEYVIYQTLVGTWPLEGIRQADRVEYSRRLQDYMEKVVREAARFSNWINPDEAYEEALRAFIGGLFNLRRSGRFLNDIEAFVQERQVTGLQHALAAQVLKLTSPGMPDIYQSTEMWDDSLVDPDNRRPVDFERLAELAGRHSDIEAAWIHRLDGAVKVVITRTLLHVRAELPELFAAGEYQSLKLSGAHGIAFLRVHGDRALFVAVGAGPEALAGATAELPERFHSVQWIDILRNRKTVVSEQEGFIDLDTDGATDGLPVAILLSDVHEETME